MDATDLRDGLTDAQRTVLRRLDAVGARAGALARSSRVVDGHDGRYAGATTLVQPWKSRYPLLDGDGNLGGDDDFFTPADPEYTELGLSPLGEALLDGEPLPVFFVNGQGPGGMLPHNLREVVAGLIAIIDDPALDLDGLMAHIPGPDLPTGGVVVDADAIRDAYATGRGLVPVRMRVRVEHVAAGTRLIFDETPYGVGIGGLLRSIHVGMSERHLRGIVDLHYETGSPAVLTFAPTVTLDEVFGQLDEHTPLSNPVELEIRAAVDGRITTLPLLDALRVWLASRSAVDLKPRLRALADRFGDPRRTEIP